MDIPIVGGSFTWSNRCTWSKIDLFLLSEEWEEYFPDISQRQLPRLLSDHILLLDCRVERRGSRPFRFENMWLHAEGFVEQVKKWRSYNYEGKSSYVWLKS